MEDRSLLQVPVPNNEAFVRRVRDELDRARQGALEVLGRVDLPKSKPCREKGVGRTGRPKSPLVAVRRERVLAAMLCGYTNVEIAEQEHMSIAMIASDIKQLREDYGARTANHLCALAAFDIGFQIVYGRPFPNGA